MSTHNWPAKGGGSAYWGDAVSTAANLPAAGQVIGEIRLVRDEDDLYRWDGSAWAKITDDTANVAGPASSVDNAIARFHGTSGKAIDYAPNTSIDDSGNLTAASLSTSGAVTAGSLDAGSAKVGSLSGVVKASGGSLSASAVGLASADVTGVLPVGNGGTNSSTALSGDRLMRSTTTAIVEADAIDPAMALVSSEDGLPVASSVSATELETLEGIEENVQDQIDGKVSVAGDIMSGALYAHGGIDVNGFDEDTLNLGTGNADVINIGRSGSTINMQGTTAYQNVENYEVTDKAITVNKGGSASSATSAGIEIEEGGSITAYMRTSSDRNSVEFKAPGQSGVAKLAPGSSTITINQSSHDPVSIGTANGLSLSTQVLSMDQASGSTTGALASSDYARFDAKRAVEGNISVSSNVTLTDRRLHFVNTSAARTLTLPEPSSSLYLIVKDATGGAGSYPITIVPNDDEAIDGEAALTLDAPFLSAVIVSDGTNYFIV